MLAASLGIGVPVVVRGQPSAATSPASAGAPPVASAAMAATDPVDPVDLLIRLRGQMADADAKVRLAAAQRVVRAGEGAVLAPEIYAALVSRLAEPVTGSTETLRAVIHAIWGQYPNPDYPRGPGKDPPMWYVRPEPKWTPPPRVPGQPRAQRPPPHDPETVDWLLGLARLEPNTDELTRALPPGEVAAVRADALWRVALLRAIAAAGTRGRRDAVLPVFDFAFVRDGLFRDECGRVIRSMGSHAVPALVNLYRDRTPSKAAPGQTQGQAVANAARRRRYAAYQLDRMDRLRPSKAVATAPDDLTRADILHAYGVWRALDAVEAVLAQVDATSHRVRREARWAWLRYVDGPPPPPSPKRKRKLPGGQEEAEEKEDYLNYREMATLEIARVLKEVSGQKVDPAWTARQMTDQLFAIYDARREEQFRQLFVHAKAREAAADLAGAVDEFGWILAHQPDHPRRAEMARAHLLLGEELAERGAARDDQALIGRALGLLRQSLALDPALPEARRVQARVHLLDARQAQRAGGDGLSDLTLAAAAAPDLPGVRAALEAARLRAVGRRGGVPLPWTGLLAGGVLLATVAWLLGRRRSAISSPE